MHSAQPNVHSERALRGLSSTYVHKHKSSDRPLNRRIPLAGTRHAAGAQTNRRYRSIEIVVSTSFRTRWNGSSARASYRENDRWSPFQRGYRSRPMRRVPSQHKERPNQRQTRPAAPGEFPRPLAGPVPCKPGTGVGGAKPTIPRATAWERKQAGPRAPTFNHRRPRAKYYTREHTT